MPLQDLPDHPLLQHTATADVRALGTLLHILLHRAKAGSLLPQLREDLSAGEHGYVTLYRGQLLVPGLDTASRVHKQVNDGAVKRRESNQKYEIRDRNGASTEKHACLPLSTELLLLPSHKKTTGGMRTCEKWRFVSQYSENSS